MEEYYGRFEKRTWCWATGGHKINYLSLRLFEVGSRRYVGISPEGSEVEVVQVVQERYAGYKTATYELVNEDKWVLVAEGSMEQAFVTAEFIKVDWDKRAK